MGYDLANESLRFRSDTDRMGILLQHVANRDGALELECDITMKKFLALLLAVLLCSSASIPQQSVNGYKFGSLVSNANLAFPGTHVYKNACVGFGVVTCAASGYFEGGGTAVIVLAVGDPGGVAGFTAPNSTLGTAVTGVYGSTALCCMQMFINCDNTNSGYDTYSISASNGGGLNQIEVIIVAEFTGNVNTNATACFDQSNASTSLGSGIYVNSVTNPWSVSTFGSVAQAKELILGMYRLFCNNAPEGGEAADPGTGLSLVGQTNVVGSAATFELGGFLESQNAQSGLTGVQSTTLADTRGSCINTVSAGVVALKLR